MGAGPSAGRNRSPCRARLGRGGARPGRCPPRGGGGPGSAACPPGCAVPRLAGPSPPSLSPGPPGRVSGRRSPKGSADRPPPGPRCSLQGPGRGLLPGVSPKL